MKWLSFAARNVFRNKRRSLMAGGVIAVGAAAIAMTLGFMLATFYGLAESTIHADVGHIQIAALGGFASENDAAGGLDAATQDAIFAKLKTIEGVRFATRRILFDGLVAKGNATFAVVGRGVEPNMEQKLSSVFAPITMGRPFGIEGGRFEALIGDRLAKKVGWTANDVLTLVATTKSGSINAVDVTSTGAYTTGIPEKDERAIMVPLAVAKSLLDTDKVSRVVVVLEDTSQTDAVLAELKTDFPSLDIRDWKALDPYYAQVVTLYSNIFGILAAIIVIVALLSISNAMMMTVFERIREIGALRAMGFSKADILKGFSLEGALVGGIGGLAGLALAFALTVGVNVSNIDMPPAPGRTTPYPLTIFIAPSVYVCVAAIMALCGIVGAFVSARKGARMSIVEALGHD